MTRPRIVFTTIVFTALIVGLLAGRDRSGDVFLANFFAVDERPTLEPFAVPIREHNLRGRVFASDGTPAVEAQVFLVSPDPAPGVAEPLHWALTDAEGSFEIRNLAAGSVRVVLSESGVPQAEFPLEIPQAEEVLWTLAEPFPPLAALPPVRRAPLSGLLSPPIGQDRTAFPVAGYEIALVPMDDVHGLVGSVPRFARTDETGHFQLDDVVAGLYRVQVLPDWAAGGSWPVLDSFLLQHDAQLELRTSLRARLRCGRLGGRLVDLEARPVEGATVLVVAKNEPGRLWPPTSTDAEGRFVVIDLPSGSYVVSLCAGSAPPMEVGAAPQDPGIFVAAGSDVEIQLEPIDPRPKR